MKLKKLMIISESMGGGVRQHILDIINNIGKNDFEIYLVYGESRADSTFECHLKNKNIKVSYYPIKSLIREISIMDIKSLIEVSKIIKKVQPDIVHCHSSKGGAIGRLAAKLNNVNKIYYTPHAYVMQSLNISPYKKKIFTYIEKKLAEKATDLTINVSNGERNFGLKNDIITTNNSIVIYNGIEQKVKNNTSRSEIKTIGAIARLDNQKDPMTFLMIAKEVLKSKPDINFILVGEGPYFEEAINFIKANNLSNNVKLEGFRRDVTPFLEKFDLFLSTSLYEGLPYSLIEALSAGMPIICTNVVGNNELVVEGVNGHLFDIKDVVQGSKKVIEMIDDKEKIYLYSENNKSIYKKKYTLEAMKKSLLNIYKN